MKEAQNNKERHYFVDEAGDLTLFNRGGKVIVGNEGCSRHFILGCALIEKPHESRLQLSALREQILADPYLKEVPSIKKTGLAFHSKDDCSEVRMQVYKLICTLPVKFYAIVRRKNFLVEWVRKNNQYDQDWHYNENKIYDACVKRLFKDRLHLADTNHVMFARRGSSPRNEALSQALQKAKENYENSQGKSVTTELKIMSNYASNEPALQIIDYGLWALQRMYERLEDRYFNFLQDKFTRIIDLDDKRFKDYGVYYDDRNILTVEKIKNSLEG